MIMMVMDLPVVQVKDKADPAGEEKPNQGTMTLDATCASQYIEFPQDINLLNEARENLEEIIATICYEYNEPKPRTHRIKARKDYLSLAKRKNAPES